MSVDDFRWPLVVMRDHRDDTEIAEGERIRYRQKPGGILPPSDWTYGVASRFEPPEWWNEDSCVHAFQCHAPCQLYLKDDEGHFYGAAHHMVERVDV